MVLHAIPPFLKVICKSMLLLKVSWVLHNLNLNTLLSLPCKLWSKDTNSAMWHKLLVLEARVLVPSSKAHKGYIYLQNNIRTCSPIGFLFRIIAVVQSFGWGHKKLLVLALDGCYSQIVTFYGVSSSGGPIRFVVSFCVCSSVV